LIDFSEHADSPRHILSLFPSVSIHVTTILSFLRPLQPPSVYLFRRNRKRTHEDHSHRLDKAQSFIFTQTRKQPIPISPQTALSSSLYFLFIKKREHCSSSRENQYLLRPQRFPIENFRFLFPINPPQHSHFLFPRSPLESETDGGIRPVSA
jgi:hypothetical protein